jgi:hypothetical protein
LIGEDRVAPKPLRALLKRLSSQEIKIGLVSLGLFYTSRFMWVGNGASLAQDGKSRDFVLKARPGCEYRDRGVTL